MMFILLILINIGIVALFLYSKLLQYRNILTGNYATLFDLVKNVLEPILGFIRKFVGLHSIGRGISIDLAQIFLLVILLILNAFLL